MAYFYIFATIVLTIYGQLIIKWRMSLKGKLPDLFNQKIIFLIISLFDPWILTAIAGVLIAGLSWMAAMTKMQLSHAYPFISITFPAVVILSGLIFHEPITIYKYIGLALIVAGVIVASQG